MKKKSLSDIRAEVGRAGGQASTAAKRKTARANGEKGGRPGNPAIARIMVQHGVSRQRAHVILRGRQSLSRETRELSKKRKKEHA